MDKKALWLHGWKLRSLVTLLILGALTPWPALSQQDDALTRTGFIYQGQLTEEGVPATGSYTFRITLYTAQTGGDELGSLVIEDVVLTNGLFRAQLNFDRAAIGDHEIWLEIAVRSTSSVEAYSVLSPRQRLTPTPYAIFAQEGRWSLIGVPVGFVGSVDKDAGITGRIADQVITDAGNVCEQSVKCNDSLKDHDTCTPGTDAALAALGTPSYVAKFDSTGNNLVDSIMFDNGTRVGVGTTEPVGKLHVFSPGAAILTVDSVRTVAGLNVQRAIDLIAGGISGDAIDFTGNSISFYSKPYEDRGRITLPPNRKFLMTITSNGDVGIGTLSPGSRLDVAGTAQLRGVFGGTGLFVNSSSNVGIGTTSPNTKLHIVGAENDGTTAALKITSGSQNMLLDGNEIDGLANGLFLNNNTNQNVVLANGGGNVGIGTTNLTAKLTVAGEIRLTSGAIRFPDGTLQSTAQVQGPAGPKGDKGAKGDKGDPGPAVTTFAVCKMGSTCVGVCSGGTLISQSQGGCTVTSDTGPCQWLGTDGVCCVCKP
jgi:hypothetical protein